jgi:hypothetical protein
MDVMVAFVIYIINIIKMTSWSLGIPTQGNYNSFQFCFNTSTILQIVHEFEFFHLK